MVDRLVMGKDCNTGTVITTITGGSGQKNDEHTAERI
jgi:hypothetical protein